MIELRPWSDDELSILQQTLGDNAMMEHLGGIESCDQILARHRRYLVASGAGGMFAIFLAPDLRVGTTGFWERTWQGRSVYETGWMILPEFAARGIATEAALAIVQRARGERRFDSLHAFPSVSNSASNAVCRKAGFVNLGECAFEYPKGRVMRCNDWTVLLG